MVASPRSRPSRRATALVVLGCTVGSVLTAGSAGAIDDDRRDRLRDRRQDVSTSINKNQSDLAEISVDLRRAQGRVDTAVADLGAARRKLAGLRDQVAAAEARDRQMQAKLDDAVRRLQLAREDLDNGLENLRRKRDLIVSASVSDYSAGTTDLTSLDVMAESTTPHALIGSMSSDAASSDVQAGYLKDLRADQVLLRVIEERVEDTKQEVGRQRAAAAEALRVRRGLAARALAAAQDVASRVDSLRGARDSLARAKSDEMARIRQLESERDHIQNQLRRIAQRRLAELRRQRAAERAARQQAAQESSSAPSTAPSSGSTSSSGFAYPVDGAYITSSYGMRLHPILNYWKLHDGTDFGAGCGTPVYAAAAGTITSEYYNEGYGNRIILDHGIVRGASVATSYNHLTSFAASAGERVSQGELIGYAGTTGYSTGCHLHFMVYVNGSTADPMNYL